MSQNFYFYDLETSGFNPREQRIMQFAGQRTNMELELIGEPHNIFIKLTEDVLPDPDAVLVTGITPQQTLENGITEAEFLKTFYNEVALEDTIFVGYNSIRFDDEFLRFINYRNFYDPYEWHWAKGRSRWDLLDVVRMTRALRPEGINWPVTDEGLPSNKLELLTTANKLEHQNAHDALSDVLATIAVAGLIKNHQPKLFNYLLNMRNKLAVEELVKTHKPFVYTSGKYPSQTEKTTVAIYLADNPRTGALVYDLRYDPNKWINKTPQELAEAWQWKPDSDDLRLPIKTLQYNRCPAIAPLTVLDDESKKRIEIDDKGIEKNLACLKDNANFKINVLKALEILNKKQEQAKQINNFVDAKLYDGFFDNKDKVKMASVSGSDSKTMKNLEIKFSDYRLNELLPLYKVRNYASIVDEDEIRNWEQYKKSKLLEGGEVSRASIFFKRLGELVNTKELSKEKLYILEELKLYAESIMPN